MQHVPPGDEGGAPSGSFETLGRKVAIGDDQLVHGQASPSRADASVLTPHPSQPCVARQSMAGPTASS
jgi:hypothetical protein